MTTPKLAESVEGTGAVLPLVKVIDRFLSRVIGVEPHVRKAKRRKVPSTLHLMEKSNGHVLAYHTKLVRAFDSGVRDLAALVRQNPGKHSLAHSLGGVDTVGQMQDRILAASRKHYADAYDLGREYAVRRVGRATLTPEQARTGVARHMQSHARFVERSLMADVHDRFARATGIVAHHRILKADDTPADGEGEAEDRRREILIALLLALASARKPEDIADRLGEIDAFLGGTAATRDAAVLDATTTMDATQAQAARAAYAGAIMDDLAETQAARVGLYSNRLWALVNDGFSSEASAAGYDVDWQTTSGDPCDDCLELESDGPYAPGQLPTVPGGGDTVCLSNCKCILELVEE